MKKIFLSSLMLLSMALVFTACSDDRDSNPTLVQPSTFTLNNPVNPMVDLLNSEGIEFVWSQPDYGGWPAAVEYQLEVSPTNSWNVSTDEAAADETGATIADYAILPSIYASCTGVMSATDLAKQLVSICQWDENSVPEKQTVYVRAKASTPGTKTIYSNVVSLEVNPYYIELADAPIELWYLVGEGIGSSDWDNGPNSVATGGLVPMYPIMGNEYDTRTGQGEIEYAGFFYAGKGFKLVRDPGNWDNQWGMGDGAFVKNDGGSGNITVEADGYYRIRLNTATDELVIEPYDGAVGVYTMISMPGGYQEWNTGENMMNGMSTSVENHDWYLMNVTYDDTELKFAADNSWDVNWGATDFPYGIGTGGGPNIPVKAGTYNVFFNDILGTYNFVAVE
ncbi:MAG: SusF/SusE family outer membrane protein [Muribaculaceae bacterium]|nr:SusF/SusE family outer membrane protein [Muribaculaceae bacterium]